MLLLKRADFESISQADLTAGMNSRTPKNVMWGAEIIADQSGTYASFLMHMDCKSPGYGNTAFKQINKQLYAKMGPNDVGAPIGGIPPIQTI